jgi:hypothetical protein
LLIEIMARTAPDAPEKSKSKQSEEDLPISAMNIRRKNDGG